MMTLSERINHPDRRTEDRRKPTHCAFTGSTDPCDCCEVFTPEVERRVPEWLRRKNEQGLPPKDMTRTVAA